MFIKVVYGEGKYVFVNPNCNVKLIYEYLRIKSEAADTVEIDLCDCKGEMKQIFCLPYHTSGLTILEPRGIYYMIFFKKDNIKLSEGNATVRKEDLIPMPHLPFHLRKILKAPPDSRLSADQTKKKSHLECWEALEAQSTKQ